MASIAPVTSTSLEQHFVLENFACSVLCARNKGHDVSSWKLRVEVRPLLMRILNNRAVHENLGAERIENISRLERSCKPVRRSGWQTRYRHTQCALR